MNYRLLNTFFKGIMMLSAVSMVVTTHAQIADISYNKEGSLKGTHKYSITLFYLDDSVAYGVSYNNFIIQYNTKTLLSEKIFNFRDHFRSNGKNLYDLEYCDVVDSRIRLLISHASIEKRDLDGKNINPYTFFTIYLDEDLQPDESSRKVVLNGINTQHEEGYWPEFHYFQKFDDSDSLIFNSRYYGQPGDRREPYYPPENRIPFYVSLFESPSIGDLYICDQSFDYARFFDLEDPNSDFVLLQAFGSGMSLAGEVGPTIDCYINKNEKIEFQVRLGVIKNFRIYNVDNQDTSTESLGITEELQDTMEVDYESNDLNFLKFMGSWPGPEAGHRYLVFSHVRFITSSAKLLKTLVIYIDSENKLVWHKSFDTPDTYSTSAENRTIYSSIYLNKVHPDVFTDEDHSLYFVHTASFNDDQITIHRLTPEGDYARQEFDLNTYGYTPKLRTMYYPNLDNSSSERYYVVWTSNRQSGLLKLKVIE